MIKILYVLPVKGGGGGAHSVAQEVNELYKMGIDARIVVNDANYSSFTTNYFDMPHVVNHLESFKDEEELSILLRKVDIVVCTIFTSVQTVKNAIEKIEDEKPRVAYYIQDYEPLFVEPSTPLWQEAYNSYTLIKDSILFAKTDWIRSVVKENHGLEVKKVQPSIDHDVYMPSFNKPNNKVWISAMVRPSSPRRAPYRTMRVLKNIDELFGEQVSINIFGCSDDDIIATQLPSDFSFHNHGVLLRKQVSVLLRKSHLFIDMSDYQAFGRTGLEAMACGCIPLVPSLGGTGEYIEHNINGYAVDPRDEDALLTTVKDFMSYSDSKRKHLQFEGIKKAQQFSVRQAAVSIFELFID